MKVAENLYIRFFLEKKEKTKDGKMPIYIELSVTGSKEKEFSIGMKTCPELWDAVSWRIIGKSPDILSMNNRLTQIRASIEKHYLLLTTQYEYVTADLLKRAYKGEFSTSGEDSKKLKEKTLCQVCNYKYSIFAKQVKKKIRSKSTLKRWKVTKLKLRKFLQHSFKKWDVPLSEIRFRHADDFMNFLTLEQGIKENTASKYIKNIKTLLELAEAKEWLSKNPWAKYMVGYDQPERFFLEMPEIIELYQHDFIDRLDYIRDTFLFACFTGYAFNELDSFKKSDIFYVGNNVRWIKIDRQKTGKPEAIPLLPIPAAIVDKYANDPYCLKHGKLLPLRSMTHYNGYLKEIADICQITRLELTSHVARHTFATTVCLENDVPLEVVQKLLGHASIRTTEIYAKVTRKKISRNMGELERKLFSFDGKFIIPSDSLLEIRGLQSQKIAS